MEKEHKNENLVPKKKILNVSKWQEEKITSLKNHGNDYGDYSSDNQTLENNWVFISIIRTNHIISVGNGKLFSVRYFFCKSDCFHFFYYVCYHVIFLGVLNEIRHGRYIVQSACILNGI